MTNEASEARKPGILVPVLLDWTGAEEDAQLQQLVGAVRRVAERGKAPVPPPSVVRPIRDRAAKNWWETPAGWAVGGAALLVATSLFLLALRAVGVIGDSAPVAPEAVTTGTSGDPAQTPGDPEQAAAPAGAPARTAAPSASSAASSVTAPPTGTIDLLNVRDGEQIVAANEAEWKDYIYGRDKPYCSRFGSQAFVIFAFPDEWPARFDRFGVFVEATGPTT